MKISLVTVFGMLFIQGALASVTYYCEDGKLYTEARSKDLTCHPISDSIVSWKGGGNGSTGNGGTTTLPVASSGVPGRAGGGGCGSNAICGQNAFVASDQAAQGETPITGGATHHVFPNSGSPHVPGYGDGGYVNTLPGAGGSGSGSPGSNSSGSGSFGNGSFGGGRW